MRSSYISIFVYGPFRKPSWRPWSHPGLQTTFGNQPYNSNTQKTKSNLKCADPAGSRTMQTWPETLLGQYPIAGPGCPYWILHILRRSYRLNLSAKDSYNPVCHSLCPSVCYLPEIQSSVSAYLFQSRLPASLFTRSVIQDPATYTKLHCLQGLCVMLYYRVGPEIPLRHTEWQIPVLIHTNSTNTFGDTCRAPL